MELKKYTKEYTIRSYECDRNNNLRIVTLMNIFQDMADINAAQLGLGLEKNVVVEFVHQPQHSGKGANPLFAGMLEAP